MRSERRIAGFTLIELMITVAIIAILTMIALPSYQTYVRKANRSAAQSFMVNAAAREEQIQLDQRSYVAVTSNANFALAPTAGGLNLPVPADLAARYDFTVTLATSADCPLPLTPAVYCVIAAAKGSQISDGNLTVTNTGSKTATVGTWQ